MYYSRKLKKFKNIRHCFFSKKGGFSRGLYKSLNCGKGSNDEKKKIFKKLKNIERKNECETKSFSFFEPISYQQGENHK